MILNDINERLLEIDPNVFYGTVDESMRETVWDYIVFNRTIIKRNGNKTSASDYFDVHIVRENHVPDGMDDEVIDKLSGLAGVRLSGENCSFAYVQKPNTNTVVEMLTIHFLRARK